MRKANPLKLVNHDIVSRRARILAGDRAMHDAGFVAGRIDSQGKDRHDHVLQSHSAYAHANRSMREVGCGSRLDDHRE